MQDEFDTLIMEINSLNIDDLKLETAVQCLKGTPDGLEDWEIIEAAEERYLEYSEQLKTRLLK